MYVYIYDPLQLCAVLNHSRLCSYPRKASTVVTTSEIVFFSSNILTTKGFLAATRGLTGSAAPRTKYTVFSVCVGHEMKCLIFLNTRD